MAKPISTEATFVQSTAGRALTRRSTIGERVRSSKRPQRPNTTADDPEQREHGQGAPLRALRDREQQADQRHREPDRARQVEAATRAHRRLVDPAQHRGDQQRTEHGRAAEQPPPAGLLGDDAGERQADRAADAQRRAHQRHSAADPALGQHVAHDADAQRDHAERGPLQRPRDDQRADVGGERAERRTHRHQRQRHDEHPALAVHVAEAPEHRRADGARHEGGGHQPGDRRRRCAEQLREAGEERDDQGLHQRHGQAARRQDPDDERGAGSHRFR